MARFKNRKFAIIPYASVTSDHISNSTVSSINDMRRSLKGSDNVICIFLEANESAYSGFPVFKYERLGNIVSSENFSGSSDDIIQFLSLSSSHLKTALKQDIYEIEITSAGTGYSAGTLTATGGGASGGGFKGTYAVSGGAIVSTEIINIGTGYTSAPTIVISDSGNGDAVITPKMKITEDNYIENAILELDFDLQDNLTYASTLTVDKNSTATANSTTAGLSIDYDHTGIAASGQILNNTALDIDVNSNSPTMVGTVNNKGIDIMCMGGTSGTQTNLGLNIITRDADTNDGISIQCNGTHLKLVATADSDDYATLSVADTGDLTIATVGDGTTDSDLIFDTDGSITLDSANGNFIAKKDGTEFSVANSAYAGMIVGYTCIRNAGTTSGDDTITIGTSFATLQTVQGTNVSIVFKAPPSGNVEIAFSATVYAVSKEVNFALSDNSTYNELNQIHTYDSWTWRSDETDHDTITVRFVVTGLTAGNSYTYYIGAKASGSSAYIYHGSTRTNLHSQPIIVKAIALPGTITTGE